MDQSTERPGFSRRELLRKTASLPVLLSALSGIPGASASSHDSEYKFLAWNTWLLGVFDMFWLEIATKPDYEQRAREIGTVLGDLDYDIMALCEVFNEAQREDILKNMGDVNPRSRVGPRSTLFKKSAGLQTIVTGDEDRQRFGETNRKEYSENGDLLCDSDAWSRKGVLHTEIELEQGAIDLYSTHMFAGGGLPFCFTGGADRYEMRKKHASELSSYIGKTSSDENVTVVSGDFNIKARGEKHKFIVDMMDRHGLYDAWERHGEGHGETGGDAQTHGCNIDQNEGMPYYCSDTSEIPEDSERIDYILLEEPKPSHEITLDIQDIKRASFWRELDDPSNFMASDKDNVPNYLGDHMALELRFNIA